MVNHRIFSQLLLFLFLNLTLRVIDAELDEYESKEFFQVTTDEIRVDKMAVKYFKSKNMVKSLGARITSTMTRSRNICNTSKNEKITFCEHILQADYLGFEFDLRKYKNRSCKSENFAVRFVTGITSPSLQASMFSCPNIFYIDLETNKKTFWKYKYHISKAGYHAAFMFYQNQFETKIYPQKYVNDIDFEVLAKESHRRKPNDSSTPTLTNVVIAGTKMKAQRDLSKYKRATKNKAVYQKFVQLFMSVNLCGLRRSHKIHICRQTLKLFYGDVDLEMEGYDEEECKQLRVQNYYNSKNHQKLSVLYCPPIADRDLLKLPHHYVSSTLNHFCATLLTRYNEKREILTIRNHFLIDWLPINKEIERVKFTPYPSKLKKTRLAKRKSSQQIEDELNLTETDMQTPFAVSRTSELNLNGQTDDQKLPVLIDNKWLVDDFIISFSKIKTSKWVYRKFMNTYFSFDICRLSNEQLRNLCNVILITDKYRLMPNYVNPENIVYRCIKRHVTMILREAEKQMTDLHSMWLCPHFRQNKHNNRPLYFVGKSHVRDAVFVFRSSRIYDKDDPIIPSPYEIGTIHPDAMITKINDFVMPDSIRHDLNHHNSHNSPYGLTPHYQKRKKKNPLQISYKGILESNLY